MSKMSKYQDLLVSVVYFMGSLAVTLFFIKINKDATVVIKKEHIDLIWIITLALSALYLITHRFKEKKAYINPIFKWLINIVAVIPILGIILSFMKVNYIMDSSFWYKIIVFSDNFVEIYLIFFIFLHLAVGFDEIKKNLRNIKIQSS